MFAFVMVLALLSYFYVTNFYQGEQTLDLNEFVLTSAVSEVDQIARLYEGSFLLSDNFEPRLWERFEKEYPENSEIRVEYDYDTEDDRFGDIPDGDSSTYFVGEGVDIQAEYTGKPIKDITVRVKKAGDRVGNWTYVSTITVDIEKGDEPK